ncbi:MAG TPA: glycosyltransferase [Armatimonadota bacterium]|jgi:glycosyltransferase involved in cell wall biosynthesis
MKIAFVCPPTANLIRPSYLGRHLARRGHEIHVIVPPSGREHSWYGLEEQPVTLHRCAPQGKAFTEVTRHLREIRPELVHCVDCGRATLPGALWGARQVGALSLVDMPDWMSRWQRLNSKLTVVLEAVALARADAVAVASQELLEYYQRRRHRAALHYLPFAVDLEYFEAHRDRAATVRAKYGEAKLLTYLGAILRQYSPQEALAMAAALARRRRDFRLLYVGRGAMQEELEAQAEALGIRELVDFVGFVAEEDLPGYLAASDVLLCPLEDNVANRNRCPNKAFWYLGARRPIVATRMGEVYRALGEEALYYRYGDAEDFADQVEKALAGAAPLPSAERAQAHAWPAVADRYELIIEELIARGRR